MEKSLSNAANVENDLFELILLKSIKDLIPVYNNGELSYVNVIWSKLINDIAHRIQI